jgi:penicillin-binding protein 1C
LVQTTLQKNLQQQTSNILEQHHQKLKGNGIQNVAALILDIERNEVISYVGNVFHPEDAEVESYVDMIPAKRSPGSTLKPLLYAAMLQDGQLLPKTLLADIPTQVAGYMPQNFNLTYDGAVHADIALARSLNVPAVRMLQQYRTERFYELMQRLGVKSLDKGPSHYGLSLILGGGENSMWEISSAYASLARHLNHFGSNSGRFDPNDYAQPSLIKGVMPQKIEQKSNQAPLSAAAIWHMFEAMQDLVRPGDEENWSQFISSRRVAWKTGTSFGFRDAWAIGLTPGYLVCVWAGNADGEGRPGLTGVQVAAPILFDVIKLLPRTPWFEQPFDQMRKMAICQMSGNKASEACSPIDTAWVIKSKTPQPTCTYHQMVHLDQTGNYRVNSSCEQPLNMLHQPWFILPPAMEWYYKNKHAQYKMLPPYKPGCEPEENYAVMEIIYPKRLSSLYIPKELDGKEGKAVIELAHRQKNIKVFWYLDGVFIGTTKEFHQLGIAPPNGRHILLVEDENGERIELPFEVVRNH